MSRDIWIISDTHLLHENILKFKDGATGNLVRGNKFSNVNEMDEFILEKWNSVVKPGDIVYHLGDVFIGDKEKFKKCGLNLMEARDLLLETTTILSFYHLGDFSKKFKCGECFQNLA